MRIEVRERVEQRKDRNSENRGKIKSQTEKGGKESDNEEERKSRAKKGGNKKREKR
jgi:hypothetical protein